MSHEPGSPAPALDLPTTTGGRWRLADGRGRIQLLIFHRHVY